MYNLDIPELETNFIFTKRPISISADLRPGWRIGVIVLLLKKCCRQQRSSFGKLHVLNWAIRTTESRKMLLNVVSGNIVPGVPLVRIEPSLNRAVDFALGERLVRRLSGDKIELTPSGLILANEIDSTIGIFHIEKIFMDEIAQRLTEAIVSRMFSKKV